MFFVGRLQINNVVHLDFVTFLLNKKRRSSIRVSASAHVPRSGIHLTKENKREERIKKSRTQNYLGINAMYEPRSDNAAH